MWCRYDIEIFLIVFSNKCTNVPLLFKQKKNKLFETLNFINVSGHGDFYNNILIPMINFTWVYLVDN